jgi:hypothetical protein
MTPQQLNDFPHLMKLLERGKGSIKPPRDEFERLNEFLDDYDEWIVKYQSNYFRVYLSMA